MAPLNWAEEQGQIIKSLGPFIDKRMRERRVYCRREQMTSCGRQANRSRFIPGPRNMGKVYLPQAAPWVPDLLAEMVAFPLASMTIKLTRWARWPPA